MAKLIDTIKSTESFNQLEVYVNRSRGTISLVARNGLNEYPVFLRSETISNISTTIETFENLAEGALIDFDDIMKTGSKVFVSREGKKVHIKLYDEFNGRMWTIVPSKKDILRIQHALNHAISFSHDIKKENGIAL